MGGYSGKLFASLYGNVFTDYIRHLPLTFSVAIINQMRTSSAITSLRIGVIIITSFNMACLH